MCIERAAALDLQLADDEKKAGAPKTRLSPSPGQMPPPTKELLARAHKALQAVLEDADTALWFGQPVDVEGLGLDGER